MVIGKEIQRFKKNLKSLDKPINKHKTHKNCSRNTKKNHSVH